MVKRKIKEWLKRYFLAEIVGTITAVGASIGARMFYANPIFISYVGSFGEAVGFYLTVLIQNILIRFRKNKDINKRFQFSDLGKILGNIALEFGPAGLIDGLMLRPFFLYLFPILLKNFTIGVLVGKIVGDVVFYILVIISYEIKTWKSKDKSNG